MSRLQRPTNTGTTIRTCIARAAVRTETEKRSTDKAQATKTHRGRAPAHAQRNERLPAVTLPSASFRDAAKEPCGRKRRAQSACNTPRGKNKESKRKSWVPLGHAQRACASKRAPQSRKSPFRVAALVFACFGFFLPLAAVWFQWTVSPPDAQGLKRLGCKSAGAPEHPRHRFPIMTAVHLFLIPERCDLVYLSCNS